jgi:hypothetical protein
MLAECSDIAVNSKEELAKQTAKLMVIDESLNKIEATSSRTQKYVRRLRMGMMGDKLHCCLCIYILLNFALLVVLLILIFIVKKPNGLSSS